MKDVEMSKNKRNNFKKQYIKTKFNDKYKMV